MINRLKDEVLDMKKEVEQIEKEEKSWAMSILEDYKKSNKRMFIICIVELIMIFVIGGYTIYLLLAYQEVKDTYQEIQNVETIENSNISNGGN